MRARALSFVLLTLVLLGAPRSLHALDVPPAPTQWFTDAAGLVPADAGSALNEKLQAFEQQSGAQFIVYVFPTLGDEALEDFTIRCAEKWKAGQKKYDNGLILFVFAKEKKIRVEVGYGLEGTVTDAVSSDVIRNVIAPRFQQGDYAGGLNAAVDALTARISKGEAPVAAGQPAHSASNRAGGTDFTFIIVIVFIFLIFILPRLRRGGGGGCGGCFLPLFFGGGGGTTFGGGGFGGGSFGGGGGGGFSGGGGGFGGGGASGGW